MDTNNNVNPSWLLRYEQVLVQERTKLVSQSELWALLNLFRWFACESFP